MTKWKTAREDSQYSGTCPNCPWRRLQTSGGGGGDFLGNHPPIMFPMQSFWARRRRGLGGANATSGLCRSSTSRQRSGAVPPLKGTLSTALERRSPAHYSFPQWTSTVVVAFCSVLSVRVPVWLVPCDPGTPFWDMRVVP